MRTKKQHQIVGGDVWEQEAYGGDWSEPHEISRAVEVAQDALGLSDLGLACQAGVSLKMVRFIKGGFIRKRPNVYTRRAIEKLLAYFERRSGG